MTINHTRNRAFATFSVIEKALAGHKKSSRGPHVTRGPYVLQACYKEQVNNIQDFCNCAILLLAASMIQR